jgi:hypothetical protein
VGGNAGELKLVPSEPATTRLVAFVAVIVSTLEAPAWIVVGFAVMVTVGTGGGGRGTTVTIAVAVAVPPAPVAVTVYVVVASGLTACVPPAGDGRV